jgi:mannose-6-phosphate isomerase-like protein (cupin superfamily)
MQITPNEALAKLKASKHVFLNLFSHGTLSLEVYQPDKFDRQQPHERDEVYVVISGSGVFLNGDQRAPFGPGDFLFVPAGVVHRFEDFTEDFCTWVIFYGPKGGEAVENS